MVGYVLLIYSLVTDTESSNDLRFMGLALSVVVTSARYLALRWMIGSMAFMFGTWIVINPAIGYEFVWSQVSAGDCLHRSRESVELHGTQAGDRENA